MASKYMLIYIKPDEEITSVIDRLINMKDKEIFLVVPKTAVLGQSSVNLKLLKREADNLDKKITIVSQDPALQRMAKKNDFLVSDSLPSAAQRKDQLGVLAAAKSFDAPILEEQISPDQFENLLKEEKKSSPLRIADIVRGAAPKGKLTKNPRAYSDDDARGYRPEEDEVVLLPAAAGGPEFGRGGLEPELFAGGPLLEKAGEDFSGRRYDFLKPRDQKTPAGVSAAQGNQLFGSNRLTAFSFPGKIFALFIVSALIITALAAFLVLPKAEILISAKREKLPIDVKIFVDRNLAGVNFEGNKIPGQAFKLEDKTTQEFLTTGQRQLNEKAKGIITVYNAYSSSPQTLVETTRFLSPQGLIFRLIQTVTIPGAKIEEGRIIASSIDISVEADQPGSEYNISPVTFTIPGFKGSPKYEGFYGKSRDGMSGGSTENVKVLTQEDFDKAKQKVWEDLKKKINPQLSAQVPANFILLKEAVSLEPGQAQASVKIGQAAEKFEISLKGIARAVIFSQDNILLLLKNQLISTGGQREFSDRRVIVYENVSVDFEKGLMAFQTKGEQEVFWAVNVDEIKALVAGKGKKEVNDIFAKKPEISGAKFSLWPFWVKKIPAQKEKIKVAVD